MLKPERLSRADAARWHMGTPANPMVIGALLLFERQLALEALEALVRDKLVPHRRFRQHVVESPHRFGAPRWLDDAAFDLHQHVRRLDPSGPVDAATLLGLVSERINAPLPLERSPWTFELVDLLPSGSALLVRIHHCIADGRALVALLEQLADRGSPEGSGEGEEQPPIRRSFEPTRARRFFGQFAGLLRLFPLSGDPVSLLRRPLNGRKCVAWSEAIPLETIKAIAAAHGHHVSDVLLAGVAELSIATRGITGRSPDWSTRCCRWRGRPKHPPVSWGTTTLPSSCPSPPPSRIRKRGSQRLRATWRSCGRAGSRASPAVS